MEKPSTIHDFGGFPLDLFNVQYPAPGSPALADEVQKSITTARIELDQKWGLDHGAWSVIKHMYPKANIPVIQMSLDYYQTIQYHYELAKELQFLRNKGVLIVGSGNVIHNLPMLAWSKINDPEYGYDWALEANSKLKDLILSGTHKTLIHYQTLGKAFNLAIPTPEHYLPLIYTLGLQEKDEPIRFFNDKVIGGSLSMTSVVVGDGF
jgi:4,5-DOPA dioxygenase extradiol